MPVIYSVRQDTRKNGSGLFYGRAQHPSVIDLDQIADRVQRNCSMKKSDCLAVMTEMVEVMQDELKNSNKVKIDGLGTFYLGIRSSGAISEKEYSALENIKSVRVGFLAEGKRSNGITSRAFTTGVTFKKATGKIG